ncbi:hypothetical protein THOM_1664 [Trachipleistophora hominis]|uniref:Uncharacterized protein n=1 Tax=Trachipleistophora hominis TaxID=72359 RepID=L7JX94_TRAHO|nr:hypothetical protein THOM_1664 [Trachipleistophora hominis]
MSGHSSDHVKKRNRAKKSDTSVNKPASSVMTEYTQTEAIFSGNFDFLIFKMLNILTANDKPVLFIIPPLILVLLNFYFDYFNPMHLSFTVFFLYQYLCGNSFYTFVTNALVYFLVVGIATFFYLKK